MALNRPPRPEARKHFDQETRMSLMEGDADQFEIQIKALDSKLDKIMWTNVGILISLATGAVLMAANILLIGSA